MQGSSQTTGERLIRIKDVEARTGLKKSQLYALQKAGSFPAAIKLSQRSAAWIESEVSKWVADRIRSARGGQS